LSLRGKDGESVWAALINEMLAALEHSLNKRGEEQYYRARTKPLRNWQNTNAESLAI